jgi:hypothetical protein
MSSGMSPPRELSDIETDGPSEGDNSSNSHTLSIVSDSSTR